MGIDYKNESEILKAIANPVRLQIITTLMKIANSGEEKCSVNDIQRSLDLPQSTISQQLSILKSRGIIVGKKYGTRTCYKIIDTRIKKIIEILKK